MACQDQRGSRGDAVPKLGRVPEGIEPSKPNAARVYNYLLGGRDNYEVDRAFAERMLAVAQHSWIIARLGRLFLLHAVRLAAEAGVRQFIDLGAGLPTSPNVHEVAQKVDPAARAVYIDYDPVVHAHANAYLDGVPGVTPMLADIRRPHDIIDRLRADALIDFTEPVAALLVGVLHHVMDDEHPAEIITRFRDAMATGSYLVFTHPSTDIAPADYQQLSHYTAGSSCQFVCRSPAEVTRWFDGFDFIGRGVIPIQHWLDNNTLVTHPTWLGGICRKPPTM
ncbi:hypothetical protein AWN90_24960 [Nocardia terpenica]|uniref:SAM-dependent methyltransferase n=1 Tax=Nocardia terpenica TaxID=455432 RepID=A0A164NGP4_9NOCA|nr:hypothetical protein AWN90_24960 [Nocardia terpenica]NQE93072.1 SAM-dependent methyltransferase [Nocardia terpenica]